MTTVSFFSSMPILLLGGNLSKKHKTRNHLLEFPNYAVQPGNTKETIVRMPFSVPQFQHLFDFLLGLCIIDNIRKKGWKHFPE